LIKTWDIEALRIEEKYEYNFQKNIFGKNSLFHNSVSKMGNLFLALKSNPLKIN